MHHARTPIAPTSLQFTGEPMKTDRHSRASWVARRLPFIAAAIAAIGCGDSTAPTPVPAGYKLTLSKSSAVVGDTIFVAAQLVDANDRAVIGNSRIVGWIATGGGGSYKACAPRTTCLGPSLADRE